jgi:acetylornithine deacetylase/succinyl-diaminopimelate desuccinylase-like protein
MGGKIELGMIRRLPPLILALALGLPAPAGAQVPRTPWDSLARDLLRELVGINTTQSAGSTLEAAHAMAARLRAAGWPETDFEVTEIMPRKGNLVARLRGRDTGKKPILLLSHLDVVEANPEDWTLPPFEFIERDGIFYGRGVADDKDEGALHLALILRMRAEGFVPDRDIIVALTADEEGGGDNGVVWLLRNRPDLVDAEFAFNEGGGGRVRDGRRISHDVQASEKKPWNYRFEVTNPGGHSSVPVADNAITHLAEALTRLAAHRFPVRLNEVTREYFGRLAGIVGGEMGDAMRRLVADPGDTAAARLLSSDPRYNAQLRTTCVATMLQAGHAANALPQRARATVNCRILPEETGEEVRDVLERVVANRAVIVTALPGSHSMGGPPSPLTPALLREIERVTESLWPGVPVLPTMSTGATDGIFLRAAGIPVYGVSGLFYPETGAHGMNERIPAQAFYEGLEFMYRLLRALTGPGTT